MFTLFIPTFNMKLWFHYVTVTSSGFIHVREMKTGPKEGNADCVQR